MDIIPFTGAMRRQWRRRGYNRLSPNRRNVKVVRFGGATKRSWRLRLAKKLRLIRFASSPLRLWYKFKNAYMNMMLRIANSAGSSNAGNMFGVKRIPKAREVPTAYSRSEFENRLVFEIYKTMVSSYELGYMPKHEQR